MDPWTQIANVVAATSALIQDHVALFFAFWIISFALGAGVMRLIMSEQIRASEALIMSAHVKAREAELGAGDQWREFEARVAAHAQQGEAAAREREDEAQQREAEAEAAQMEAREEVDKLRLISIRLLGLAQRDRSELEQAKNEIEAHARKAGVAVTDLLRLSRRAETGWPKGFIPVPIAWPMEGRAATTSAGADLAAAEDEKTRRWSARRRAT
jgi:hypothetical protein